MILFSVLTIEFLMWLILLVKFLDFKGPEVLTHSERSLSTAVNCCKLSGFTLSLDLSDDMPLNLFFVIPVQNRGGDTTGLTGWSLLVSWGKRGGLTGFSNLVVVFIICQGKVQDGVELAVVLL